MLKFFQTLLLLFLLPLCLPAQCGGNGGLARLHSGPQAIGTTVDIVLEGPATLPYGIYLSAGLQPLTLPGLGTVCLNVADPSFQPLFSGSLPASGLLTISLPIANNPALLNLVFYLQAVTLDSAQPGGVALSRTMRVDFEQPDGFTSLPPLAAPRALASAALGGDGRVIVTGGGSGSLLAPVGTSTTEIFDSLTRSWSPGPLMTVDRAFHTATPLPDGRVLICGGFSSSLGAVTPTADIYDPVTGAMTPAAPMGSPRAAHTATLLDDGRVLVAGGTTIFTGTTGQILNAALNTAETYDPVSNTWTPVAGVMASRRMVHGAVKLPDGRVLLISGLSGATSFFGQDVPSFTSSTNFFVPASNSFTSAPGIGSGQARAAFGAALHPATGQVVVFGGVQSVFFVPTATATTRVFNGSSWSAGPNLPAAVALPGTVTEQNGQIHVSGGATGTLLAPGASAFCRAWNGSALLPKASLPLARAGHVSVLLPDGQILIAGGADANGVSVADAWLYTPDP